MNNVTLHSASNSKAKALMGRLLSDLDYKKLEETKNFNEFLLYLTKNTFYSNVFPIVDDIIHRNQVEIGMKKNILKNFEKFYHYYNDDYRKLFKILFMRYEIENLKLFLRALTRNEEIQHLKEHLITSEIYSSLDYSRLLKSRNIGEFIESLSGTQYYQLLKVYLVEESEKMQFYMEMVLDRVYFRNLKEIIIKLQGKDKKLMEELLGVNSDLLNIQWIYRAKKFYFLSPEEILNYTLESGLKYDFKRLKVFCYMDPIEDLVNIIMKTEYKVLFSDGDIFMERNMERYLFYLLDSLIKKGNQTIIIPIAYMHKLEYEARDLYSILEGIKYEVKNIDEYLVRILQ
ncbi:MAG: V-type ATPase subunit [Clostridiales bacterium]|nr:V-type ATPase subunit [Clostridiales bacterium]